MSKKYQKIKLGIAITIITIVVLIFLSFNSYWSNGITDQSEIINNTINYTNTDNALGFLGAKISEFFIRLFGITSYLILSFTFLVSLKLIVNTKRINTTSLLLNHLFFIMWLPVFLSQATTPLLSGQFGISISNHMTLLIGTIGLMIVLLSLLILILIFNTNPSTLLIWTYNLIDRLRSLKKEKKHEKHNNNQLEEEKKSNHNTNLKSKKNITSPDQDNTIIELAKKEKLMSENKILHNKNPEFIEYQFPQLNLLKEYEENTISINELEVETNKKLIEDTLKDFKIDVTIKRATIGPTITLYEIVPDEGVRIAKIKNLENDIALRIKAIGVRIIAPLPGKGTVGIEVPNQNPTIVSMKNVLASEKFQTAKLELPIALGKTISNETFVMDLTKMPHLLIAGATGQGKSVGLNTILCSILYKKHPSEVKFILVDPKKVELTLYNKIEKHFLAKLPNNDDAIITDTKQVVNTLKSLCLEMDRRYDLLKEAEVRNIQEYNKKHQTNISPNNKINFLPYLILVIDEFADLIMTAGKEIEIPIARLAQLSRAIGIHLIIATQRPTTNIITGTIKANFPTRIAFRVIQGIDSKTILDTVGANQLIGRGDMLISTGSSLSRIQCAFIDTSEVDQLTQFIGNQKGGYEPFILPKTEEDNKIMDLKNKDERDPLFKDAALLIIMHQQGSTSMIQRKLKLGYNRAGRIIDQLEDAGILGPLEGSKGRKVLIETEAELNNII